MPGSANDIAIGANGEVFIVSTLSVVGGYAVKQWKNNQWKVVPGRGALRIAVSSIGIPWAVDNANKVLKLSGQTMLDTGGFGRDIAAGDVGYMYVIRQTPVGGGYSVKKYENGCWFQLSGGGVAITAHGFDGEPVIINNLGMIAEY